MSFSQTNVYSLCACYKPETSCPVDVVRCLYNHCHLPGTPNSISVSFCQEVQSASVLSARGFHLKIVCNSKAQVKYNSAKNEHYATISFVGRTWEHI